MGGDLREGRVQGKISLSLYGRGIKGGESSRKNSPLPLWERVAVGRERVLSIICNLNLFLVR